MAAAIRFPRAGAFHKELKTEVERYFAEHGKSKLADRRYFLKAGVFFTASVLLYTAVLTAGLTGLSAGVALALFGLLGFVHAQIGFNIGHDAIHGAVSDKPWVNRIFGWSFDVAGASSVTWAVAHNFVHHTYTNVPGVDHDLEPGPWMRFYERDDVYWPHRFQHLYGWLLYGFTTLVWVFRKDFVQAVEPDPRTGRRPPPSVLAKVVAGKVLHLGLFIAVPLAVTPFAWWQVLLAFLTFHVFAGLTLAVVFQLAHNVEVASFPRPDEGGSVPRGWAEHQMFTTVNFAVESPLALFFTGGLNHQVEHHLFAKINHVHYPALRPIVQRVASKHGLPYLAEPTFGAALGSHYRMLKRFGAGAAAPSPLAQAPREQPRWAA